MFYINYIKGGHFKYLVIWVYGHKLYWGVIVNIRRFGFTGHFIHFNQFAKAVPLFSIKYMYFPIDISSYQVGRHLWFNAPLRLGVCVRVCVRARVCVFVYFLYDGHERKSGGKG